MYPPWLLNNYLINSFNSTSHDLFIVYSLLFILPNDIYYFVSKYEISVTFGYLEIVFHKFVVNIIKLLII